MKDSGFDFHPDVTYSTVDKKLQDLFPDLLTGYLKLNQMMQKLPLGLYA